VPVSTAGKGHFSPGPAGRSVPRLESGDEHCPNGFVRMPEGTWRKIQHPSAEVAG